MISADETNFEEELDQLETEKASLNAIIGKINDKDTFNFFTDEGLLPNYSFPEAGVVLRSIILRKKAKADEYGKYSSRVYEYERPAATAISELAPANRFYAEGRMVTVDQIDMSLSPIEEWRFCNECAHHELILTGGDTQSCPHCHSTLWKDDAQRRQMVRMRQVVATTYDKDSRSYDDNDSREPEFYSKQMLVDFDEKFIDVAYKLEKPDLPFGFEFLSKVTFREINFGQQEGNTEEINIAGKPMPKVGFVVCRECGKVHKAKERFEHAITCRYRSSKSETPIEDCLYLYREFTSEAIRILLPVISLAEEQRLHSFIAALYLGLKKKFRGSIDHLRTAVHEEPIPNSSMRKKYLVLYDIVPGGTGYLKELMRAKQPLMEVFEMAREVLRSCECGQTPEKDGCYRCLYIYRQSHDRANVSRKVAMDFLARLLDSKPEFVKTDTISNISINSLLESELEARFVEALRRSKYREQASQLKPQIVNGKPGWSLTFGGQTWLVEPQLELGTKEGVAVPAKADFLFYPERSGKSLPVAVFTDGFMFHAEGENHRIGRDMAQRMAVVRSGRFQVWSLTWDDVEDKFMAQPQSAFENFTNYSPANLGKLLAARGLNWMLGLHERRSLDLFVEFLASPEPDAWRTYAAVNALNLGAPALVNEEAASTVRESILDQGACPPKGNGGTFYTAFFERKHEEGDLLAQCCTIVGKAAIQKSLDTEIEIIGRLFDEDPGASKPGFKSVWGGFLRAFNIFQFLPRAFFVSSRGLKAGEYAALLENSTPTGRAPAPPESTALIELLGLAVPEVHALLKQLSTRGFPLPEPGYELPGAHGEVIATAELAWPNRSLALLLDSELGHESSFAEQSWKTIKLADALASPETFFQLLSSG